MEIYTHFSIHYVGHREFNKFLRHLKVPLAYITSVKLTGCKVNFQVHFELCIL